MNKQLNALEIAQWLDDYRLTPMDAKAAKELRRLHAENAALREKLAAAPVAEPVAWRKADGAITDDPYRASCWRDHGRVEPLYLAPPQDTSPPNDERRFYRDALKAALDALENSRPLPRDGDDDYAETGFRKHIFATNRVHAALFGKRQQDE